jgi:hypothetical protein
MASATPYPDGSNRTEGGPCQDDLRPAQGFTPILVYAQVFGVGFHGALRINTTATRCSAASERPVRCARNL